MGCCSCQNFRYHVTVHVCQAESASLLLERETLVINAQKVQHRGLKIMYMHRILDNIVAEVIRFAKAETRSLFPHLPSIA